MANTNNIKNAVGNLGKELNSSMKNWATNKSESVRNWSTENKKEIKIALISAGIGFAITSLITKKRPEIIISTLNVDTEDPYAVGMRYNQGNKEDK